MSKWYWHIHHETLIERTYGPIRQRISFIKTSKKTVEVPLRLSLLKPVRAKLSPLILSLLNYNYSMSNARRIKAQAALHALHTKECPNCTFKFRTKFQNFTATRGTIFPRGWRHTKRNRAAIREHAAKKS